MKILSNIMQNFIAGLVASSAADEVVKRTTGKTIGEHTCDTIKKVYENDKKYFEESNRIVFEEKEYQPWMTEHLDSGPQPCLIF